MTAREHSRESRSEVVRFVVRAVVAMLLCSVPFVFVGAVNAIFGDFA